MWMYVQDISVYGKERNEHEEMKIRTVKKVIKEFMIKGRKTPLAKKVTLDNLAYYRNNNHNSITLTHN